VLRVRSAAGIWGQGRDFSWANSFGWLFDRGHEVRAAGGEQVSVPGLGMQSISDEQNAGQAAENAFDSVEKWCERGDFVGLRVDGDLGQDDAGAGVERGQQMHLTPVGAAGTT
jgi:hypothetical protein